MASLAQRRLGGRRSRAVGVAGLLLAGFGAGLVGFHYATWRAEARLADELPPAWEGRDIAVVGVIDDLPQANDRGARFAFAVEGIETQDAVVPSRISLAWYAARARDDSDHSAPTSPRAA
ncbi:MAG: DUF4131 domain-containing protein [Polyangia bacterium]